MLRGRSITASLVCSISKSTTRDSEAEAIEHWRHGGFIGVGVIKTTLSKTLDFLPYNRTTGINIPVSEKSKP